MAELDSEKFDPQIEVLNGIQVTEQSVTIIVESNGCTQKEDFIAVLSKAEPPEVTFIRLQPDLCRAAPRPLPIKFTLEEIGAKMFTVANPLDPMPRW